MGLVEGQETSNGPEGQTSSVGFEGQASVQPRNDDPDTRRVEGQCTEDDTSEGQESNSRPFDEKRPYSVNQPAIGPGANSVTQGGLPPSVRRVAGSQKLS
jgi:hypothetical protein